MQLRRCCFQGAKGLFPEIKTAARLQRLKATSRVLKAAETHRCAFGNTGFTTASTWIQLSDADLGLESQMDAVLERIDLATRRSFMPQDRRDRLKG